MLTEIIRQSVMPLPALGTSAFGELFRSFGHYQVVLLGDASHGTSEFYDARAEITKYLIVHHGFNLVACEADWPDAADVHRYVTLRPGLKSKVEAGPKEPAFQRFPTWMWRNREVQEFVHWLRAHNEQQPSLARVGFFGLDLYSLHASMAAVIDYLDHVDPKKAAVARQRYGRLQPFGEDPAQYGLANLHENFESCEADVVAILRDLLRRRLEYARWHHDGEEYMNAEQNATVVADAEEYYRSMFYGDAQSWNLRDSHMFDTLAALLARPRPAGADLDSPNKAVVWAHNSHIGDARATAMGRLYRELNLGQLTRQQLGAQNVAIICCGTHTGTVTAAQDWGGKHRVMQVNPSRPDSYEFLCHQTGIPCFLLDLRGEQESKDGTGVNGSGSKDGVGTLSSSSVRRQLIADGGRLERFIGVIYRPSTEKASHYTSCLLPRQMDAYLWFDESHAVSPLEEDEPKTMLGEEETYPFAM